MATNYVSEGKAIVLNVGTDKKSGDPVAVGEIVGVCLVDADANGDATVATEGIFNLSVVAQNYDTTNSVYVDEAIAVGDALYYDATGQTPVINKNSAGTLFGYALEAVAAGATATIPVKLSEK